MNLVLSLTVDVVPVPQPRQRYTLLGGRIHNYTPTMHPANAYKAYLRLAVQAEMRRRGLTAPLEGPVILEARFYLPRPQRLNSKRYPDGPLPHKGRLDLNNLLKSTEDALLGLLYRDDSQVYRYGPQTGKWYHEKGGHPRVELAVWAVDEAESDYCAEVPSA